MIKNLPGRFSQKGGVDIISNLGSQDDCDFFYIPQGPHGKKASKNYGYGFGSSASPARGACLAFQTRLDTGEVTVKARVLTYALAHLQGQESLVTHFQDSWVLRKGLGPVLKTSEGEEVQVACSSTAKGGEPTQTQKMKEKVKKADTPKVELDGSCVQTRYATSPVCCSVPERPPVTQYCMKKIKTTEKYLKQFTKKKS